MKISQLKGRVVGLYPTLEAFNVTAPIRLLKRLVTISDVFVAVEVLEAAAVRKIAYYLEEEDK